MADDARDDACWRFAKNLTALREELRYENVEALAEAVDISTSTIYKYLAMKQVIRIDALDKIAKGLGIDVAELLMHPDKRPRHGTRS